MVVARRWSGCCHVVDGRRQSMKGSNMGKRIDHEIRDAVLRGLKMGQAVYVHPRASEGWTDPLYGTIVGWSTGWGPDMVEVKVGNATFEVRRVDVISAEVYEEVESWKHRCDCGADLTEYGDFNAKDMCVDCVDAAMAAEVTA